MRGAREDAVVSLPLATLEFRKIPPKTDKPGVERLEDRCCHVPGARVPQADLYDQVHPGLEVPADGQGRTTSHKLLPLQCLEFGPAAGPTEPATVCLEEHEGVWKEVE
jgi:hypothetical protein